MSFRPLTTFEKKLLSQSLDNQTNGTIFSAKYSLNSQITFSDEATLTTNIETGSMIPIFVKALSKLVSQHPELHTTINNKLEFETLPKIKTDDVINLITFESSKDEFVNCHLGPPPYLQRHIFNNNKFAPGNGKPLWSLYILDESLVIFHGHDVLFDIFAAATFHRLLFEQLNTVGSTEIKMEYLYNGNSSNNNFPRSIYDNPMLHIPAVTMDLVNSQTTSFFKSMYHYAIKKPINMLTLTNEAELMASKAGALSQTTSLCGTTVYGHLSTDRFEYLKSIASQENVCTRSFICAVVLICLKPLIKDFTSSISFSLPMDLRSDIPDPSQFGLFYKDIVVECPLSLVDDSEFEKLSFHNGYDATKKQLKTTDSEYAVAVQKYQFQQIADHVSTTLKQRMNAWRRNGFNDDDIKRMKFQTAQTPASNKLIYVNDIADFKFDTPSNKSTDVTLSELSFTQSLAASEFMSVSYTHSLATGANICIHYPQGYNMDQFVEQFQQLLED